jgi:hypothetical protein
LRFLQQLRADVLKAIELSGPVDNVWRYLLAVVVARGGGAMQISWRVAFLIVAAAGAMHLSLWRVFAVLVGYLGFEQLDRMLSQRAKEKAIHDVMCGWKVSAEDPEYEDKREVSRARLTGSDQIIATRVVELLTSV